MNRWGKGKMKVNGTVPHAKAITCKSKIGIANCKKKMRN